MTGGWKLGAGLYRIGIDVGGTFTDLVAIGDDASVTLAKVLSTPLNPCRSVAGRRRRARPPRRDIGPRPRGAAQLEIARVVVPRVAAVLSAWGMLATDLRFEVVRTHVGDTASLDGAGVKRLFDEIEAEGFARLRASFAGLARTARSADMRYGEQVFEIAVPLDDVDWHAADPLPEIAARFHARHEALYTYCLPEEAAVPVNARVAVSGMFSALPQEPELPAGPAAESCAMRPIRLGDGWVAAPVYDFAGLAPGQSLAGPALVDGLMTTVLLRSGDHAVVTLHGWLDIAVTGSVREGTAQRSDLGHVA